METSTTQSIEQTSWELTARAHWKERPSKFVVKPGALSKGTSKCRSNILFEDLRKHEVEKPEKRDVSRPGLWGGERRRFTGAQSFSFGGGREKKTGNIPLVKKTLQVGEREGQVRWWPRWGGGGFSVGRPTSEGVGGLMSKPGQPPDERVTPEKKEGGGPARALRQHKGGGRREKGGGGELDDFIATGTENRRELCTGHLAQGREEVKREKHIPENKGFKFGGGGGKIWQGSRSGKTVIKK